MDVRRCWLCGREAISPLRQIPGGRSVTTDGLLLEAPWRKYQCTACDLVLSDPTAALRALLSATRSRTTSTAGPK